MTQEENTNIYYLKSCLRNLKELQEFMDGIFPEDSGAYPTIGSEILADNIDWLDCYIEKLEKDYK